MNLDKTYIVSGQRINKNILSIKYIMCSKLYILINVFIHLELKNTYATVLHHRIKHKKVIVGRS